MKKQPDRDEWDDRLMSQVALGSHSSLTLLLRKYKSPLLTFVVRMVRNYHRGEELVQDVFLTVWLKRAQYESSRTFSSWLFAIAANRCHAKRRKSGDRDEAPAETEEETLLDGELEPCEAAMAAETAAQIEEAVSRLPKKQQSIFTLRAWNELPFAEIAKIEECSEAAVRSHLRHAMTTLRKQLSRSWEGRQEDPASERLILIN